MSFSIIILFFFSGATFGSFFYTLAVRFINGTFDRSAKEGLFAFSHCPVCQKRISPIYLFPILGYMLNRGKCSNCSTKIDLRYPIYEIIFGLLALITYQQIGLNIYSINIFFLIAMLLTITIIDIAIQKIPNSLLIVFIILSIYPTVVAWSIKENFYGFLLMTLFFLVIMFIFPGSFGGGDLKLASIMGATMGLSLSIIILETALITGAIIGTIYAIVTKKGFRTKIAFAPFLTIGYILATFYGEEIILLYLKFW